MRWRPATSPMSAREMAVNGGCSDAFKRAAVWWGLGRYLYDIDAPWVRVDGACRIEPAELARLKALLPAPAPGCGAPALAEAVNLTQIPRSTMYQMIAQGKLRTAQIGGRHDMPMTEVERLCTEGVRTGDDGSPPAIARLVVGLVVGTNLHPDKIISLFNELNDGHGGWGGIRTPGEREPTPVFKTGALNHSATHPLCTPPAVDGAERLNVGTRPAAGEPS